MQQNENTTEISFDYRFPSEIDNNSTRTTSNTYNNFTNNSVVSQLDTPTDVSEINFLLNETQTVQKDENDTEISYMFTSFINHSNNPISNRRNINNDNDNNSIGLPTLDPLIKIAITALVLHILIIGGGKQLFI